MSQEPTSGATPRRSGEGGPASRRVEVRRHPDRARYDRATIDAILDEALICHLGVIVDGEPLVLPTGFGRLGDTLYLHGAAANRSLAAALEGACVTVTHVDGLVLARSAFGHSMNYRSVVVRGRARAVTDPVERRDGLRAVVEHALPGRWDEVRQPSPREMDATAVIALDLAECSAKVRTGPPLDPASDLPRGSGRVRSRFGWSPALPVPTPTWVRVSSRRRAWSDAAAIPALPDGGG